MAIIRHCHRRQEVLLVRRGTTNLQGRPMSYAAAWVFPGGKVDPGEVPLATAVREVREEVGLELDPDTLVWLWELPSESGHNRHYCTQYYTATVGADVEPRPAAGELVDHRWIEVREAFLASRSGRLRIPPATTETLRRLSDTDLRP